MKLRIFLSFFLVWPLLLTLCRYNHTQ